MTHDQLLENIHEVSLSPERWPLVLESMARYVGADAGVMMALAANLSAPLYVVGWRFGPPGFLREQGMRHLPNPWVLAAAQLPVGEPAIMSRIIALPELATTSFYDEVVLPADVPHAMGTNTVVDDELAASVSLYRRQDSGEFDDEALQRFRALIPALTTATRVNARLRQLELFRDAALDALDDIPLAVFLLRPDGRVAHANGAARSLASNDDGLALRDDRLVLADPAQGREFGRLLAEAGAGRDRQRAAASLAVRLPSGRRPYVLLLASSAPRTETAGGLRDLLAVYTSDPDRESTPPAILLRAAYGLTYAEAEMAAAIATGRGAIGAARDLGISENTARTHLKRVFQKTDTHSQAELVRLLHETLPMLRSLA